MRRTTEKCVYVYVYVYNEIYRRKGGTYRGKNRVIMRRELRSMKGSSWRRRRRKSAEIGRAVSLHKSGV